jgi:hypothetical protein
MLMIKRLVLDVLKPHKPDVLEFSRAIAAQIESSRVKLKVLEMDDKTETLELTVEGNDLVLETIAAAIREMGGSLHSVDEVEVVNALEEESM